MVGDTGQEGIRQDVPRDNIVYRLQPGRCLNTHYTICPLPRPLPVPMPLVGINPLFLIFQKCRIRNQ